jgi:hypothetical protein
MGALHEAQYKFVITALSFLLRMRYFSVTVCRENQITHIMAKNISKIRSVYETIMKNIV